MPPAATVSQGGGATQTSTSPTKVPATPVPPTATPAVTVLPAMPVVAPATPTALVVVEAEPTAVPTTVVEVDDPVLPAIIEAPQPTPTLSRPTALLPRTGGSQSEPGSVLHLLSLGALVLGLGLLLVRRPGHASR